MTRANAQHSTSSSSASSHDSDLDADDAHDTSAARLASQAGLRREANAGHHIGGGGPVGGATAKAKPSDATPAERKQQRDRAEHQAFEALQATIVLAAIRMNSATEQIKKSLAAEETPAGVDGKMSSVQDQIDLVDEALDRLTQALKQSEAHRMIEHRVLLKDVGHVYRAYVGYWSVLKDARDIARIRKGVLKVDTTKIETTLDGLHKIIDPAATSYGRKEITQTSVTAEESTVETTALNNNLEAAFDTARAMRMSMNSEPTNVLMSMLGRVFSFTQESAAIVKELDKKTIQSRKKTIATTIDEINLLIKESSKNPDLVKALQNQYKSFGEMINSMKKKAL